MVYVRPLDLSMDETLYAIQAAVDKVGAKRVVLDSISGLEAALAPAFKEDFLESLYRLLGALTGVGITILLTVEVTEPYNDMRFTPHPDGLEACPAHRCTECHRISDLDT